MDKRVVTIIAFFAVFALLLIIGATVFVVRDVQVSFLSADESNVIASEDILSSSGITAGRNIFAVSEIKAVSSIESAHPAIKVINIERKFPSTIIIHVTVRIPIIAVKVKDQNNYAMLDREMFVVQILSLNELTEREKQLGYSLTRVNYELSETNVKLGHTVPASASNENAVVQNLIVAYEKENLLNKEFCGFVKRIFITKEVGRSIYDVTMDTVSGVDIKFEASGNLLDKANLSYKWYLNEKLTLGPSAESLTSGYIVYIPPTVNDGKSKGYFTWYRYTD